MSYTLELLRLDSATTAGGGANSNFCRSPRNLSTPMRRRRHSKRNDSAKVESAASQHSYYECCINVHVSSLLEHWLDWDRPNSTDLHSKPRPMDTSSSLSSSPTSSSSPSSSSSSSSSSSTPPSCLCLSQIETLDELFNSCLDYEPPSRRSQHRCAKSESSFGCCQQSKHMNNDPPNEDDLCQSWFRKFFKSEGCDQDREDSGHDDDDNDTEEDDVDDIDFEDIYNPAVDGSTLIKYLFKGNVNLVGHSLVHATRLVLETGLIDARAQDEDGNVPIMQIQHLLRRGLFQESVEIAHLFLILVLEDDAETESVMNHVNRKNRTLLSYSVGYGDRSATLTRLLVNAGAKVWPMQQDEESANVIYRVAQEKECSAFTWLLRSLMDRNSHLEDARETLFLLASSMADQPVRMKQHVTRTMMQLGKGIVANGELFKEVKSALSPYWTTVAATPQPLRFQCLRRIRRAIGPKRLTRSGNLSRLSLPNKLCRFITLEEPMPVLTTSKRKSSLGHPGSD